MKRGDIYNVDLEPLKGREQRGQRPVIVTTPSEFNQHNPPIVCPITGGGAATRLKGFAVSLMNTGMKTEGDVICSQPRVLDVKAVAASTLSRRPLRSSTKCLQPCKILSPDVLATIMLDQASC